MAASSTREEARGAAGTGARALPVLLAALLAGAGCSVVNDPGQLEPGADTTVPPAPQGLAATPGTSSVALRWDPVQVADLARYVVLVGTVSGELASAGESADPSFVVTGLAPGTYYFSAVAIDEAGNVSDLAGEIAAAPDGTPPSVTLEPADGAGAVEVHARLVLAFSEAMERPSAEGAVAVTRADGGAVPACGFGWEPGDRVAVCTFASSLAASQTYTVAVGAGATDRAGNALAPASATFTTAAGPDATPPTVASAVPPEGAAGVPPEADVAVTFSEAMSDASTAAFRIETVGGDAAAAAPYRDGRFAWSQGGRTLTYDPPTSFPEGALVTYTVGPGACDRAANCLQATHAGSFRIARRTTLSVEGDAAFDGYARRDAEGATAVSAATGYLFAGDDAAGRPHRSWLSFPHAALSPAPTRILSASVEVFQGGCVGSPYEALDAPRLELPGTACSDGLVQDCDRDLLARHVDAGASLGEEDFSAAVLPSGGVELAESGATGWVAAEVGSLVQADRDAGRDRTQLRLEFPEATNADGIDDYCMFYSADATAPFRPRLEVTFEHQ